MKNILIFLLSLISITGFGQTPIPPGTAVSRTIVNDANEGCISLTGTDIYAATVPGASYVLDHGYAFKFTNGNATTSPTINLNGAGPISIRKYSAGSLVAVAANDLKGTMRLRYDGTYFVLDGIGNIGAGGGGGSGTVTTVTGTAPIVITSTPTTTPNVTVTQATTSTNGYLSSTDWNTFNGKQSSGSYAVTTNNLSDLSSASTARSNLGLGTLATQSGTFSGTSSGTNTGDQTNITGNAATVTTNANLTGPVTSVGNATTITNSSVTNAMLAGSIDLTTKVTGLLPVANGGTGTSSPGIVAGTNVTVTGTWPNQTVNSTGAGVSIASLAETQAGTDNTKVITPLRLASVSKKVYNIIAYNGVGDGRIITDGAITASAAILTSASATFTSADVGKAIKVYGAGAAGANLLTTVASFTNSTTVVLTANASTTVSGAEFKYGTDNTTPIQNAINAAYANPGGATIFFPVGLYFIAGSLQTSVGTGPQNPNCQIYLPQTSAFAQDLKTITFYGEVAPNNLKIVVTGGLETTGGVILESLITGSGTRPRVIGAVKSNTDNFDYCGFNAYNIHIRTSSKTGTTHVSPTMTAFGMQLCYDFNAFDCLADTESPQFNSAEPTTSTVVGFEMPTINNSQNAGGAVVRCQSSSYYKGYEIGEHTNVQSSMASASEWGFAVQTTGSVATCHIQHAYAFQNKYNLVVEGNCNLVVDYIGLEQGSDATRWYFPTADFYAPSSVTGKGYVHYTKNGEATYTNQTNFGQLFFYRLNGTSQRQTVVGGGAYPHTGGTGEWNGNIDSSSKSVFEIRSPNSESGSGGGQPDFVMSHVQNGTSDATVARFVVENDGSGNADKRIVNINYAANGNLQKGLIHYFIGNGAGVTDVHRISTDDARFAVNTIFGSVVTNTPSALVHVNQPALTTSGGLPSFLVAGGAHTNLTLSTELTDVNYNLARTVQFATGALTTQRAFRIQAPTYGFVGASTITTASTVSISGAPVAGTNATITNGFALDVEAGTSRFQGGIKGSITNDAATAGNMGEYVSSLIAVGSAVSLTTATAANVTSISLTAGDWDVTGIVNFSETTSTVTARVAGLSSTTATLPTDGSEGYCGVQSTVTSETNSIGLTRKRFSLASTTTIFLVGQATFSAGTCAGFGNITARRIR